LWDVATRQHLQTFKGHSGPVFSVAFSSQGVLASGSADQTVRLWDIDSQMRVRILRRYPEWVLAVAFSPDGAKIAAGGSDQTVWICDASTGSSLRGLKGHAGRVTSVAFSSDGQKLVSGSMDHTVRFWNARSGANILTFGKHTEWVMSVALSGDSKRIVSGSEDKTIRVWDLAGSAQLESLRSGDEGEGVGVFSADRTCLALTTQDAFPSVKGSIQIWDSATGVHLRTLLGSQVLPKECIAFSPDNTCVAAGSLAGPIQIWTPRKDNRPRVFGGYSIPFFQVLSLSFSRTGETLASGQINKTVDFWDVDTGLRLRTLLGHSEWVSSAVFTRDNARLVARAIDGMISLWDLQSGSLLERIRGPWPAEDSTPNDSEGHAIFMMCDGWLCAAKGKRRICWIPVTLRPTPIQVLASGGRIFFRTGVGKSVIFEIAKQYL
jgi:WD40 repeat protein